MNESTALAEQQPQRSRPPALTSGGALSAFVPTDIDQAFRIARAIAMSGMAPKSYGGDENKCFVGIMAGAELGLLPFQALQSIAVIGNNPAIWGDGALALVQASGLLEDIEETDDGNTATCKLVRKGRTTPILRSFSMEDAKKAGLAGKAGPWTQYPQRMRQMRARSWAMRDGFADVLKGLHIAEEVRDRPDLMDDAPKPQRISSAMLAQQAGETVEQVQEATVSEMEIVEAEVEDIADGQHEADEARRERLAADIQDDEIAEAAQQTLNDIDGPLEAEAIEAEPEAEAEPPFMGKVREIRAAIDKCSTIIDLNSLAKDQQVHVEALPEDWADAIKRDFAAVRARLQGGK
jgi:hypothetical protein